MSVMKYLPQFFSEWEMLKKKVLGTTNHSFLLGNFSPDNRSAYEIGWKNGVQADGPQMTV